MKTTLMHGVPASLQMDAWWMSGDVNSICRRVKKAQDDPVIAKRAPFHMIVLLALILLADWLFWGYGTGLSLLLFAVALAAAIWATSGRRITLRDGMIAGVTLIVGMLPVLIYVQTLSVLFYGATLVAFAAYTALKGRGKIGDMLHAGLRFLTLAPVQVARDIASGPREILGGQDWQGIVRYLLRAWGLPVIIGTVFLMLFLQGNPIFEKMAIGMLNIDADVARLGFWLLIGVLVWPFLVLRKMRHRLMVPISLPFGSKMEVPALINAQSVTNSLVLFNLMFATQTGLDVVYLWGGAALPDGMSLATYAHRGAYPLVVTALLAGIFALISRPYAQARLGLRILLLLWLVQNVALTAGSVLRLELYVEAFGLTYLRVAAFIWMGMVAAGLVLIFWQVLRERDNLWMMARMSLLLVAVLYVCSFVNFADVIAKNNLAQGIDPGQFRHADVGYICALGPMALPAIVDYERQTGWVVCKYGTTPVAPEIGNWREWGFRKWQVQGYLAAKAEPEMSYE